MTGHFVLDVHPETLRQAGRTLETLAAHADTKGRAAARTPGDIGDQWTGQAATAIKAEMTGLGTTITAFAPDLRACTGALTGLADDYDDALDQVRRLNQQWAQADADYAGALSRADHDHETALRTATPAQQPLNRAVREEIDQARSSARSAAYDTCQQARHDLEYSFGMLRQWLAQQTRAAAARLVDAAPLRVPVEAVSAYRGSGTYPVRLDRGPLEQRMRLVGEFREREVQRELVEDGRETARALEETLGDVPAELAARIRANSTNPYFAHGFASETDPEQLAALLTTFEALRSADPEHEARYADVYEDLVVGLGTTIATATRGRDGLALPDDYAARWADAVTAQSWMEGGDAPTNQAQYLMLLMEQGEWGTAFLDELGDRLYDYEIAHGPRPVWTPKSNHMDPVVGLDGLPRVDVMAQYMTALGHNPEAAQRFFAEGGGTRVDVDGQEYDVGERLQYLLQERTWSHDADATNGGSLGAALQAATTELRDPTPAGRTSAELAAQTFLLIGDRTGDDASGGFLGLGSNDGWQMWDGMRESVAAMVASYAPDLMRVGRTGQGDELGGAWYVDPEEAYWGSGAPYGARMDPGLMQRILGSLAENDAHIDTVLAGLGAATQIRMDVALELSLADGSEPSAPVAMLQGYTLPQIDSATNESAATLGWVLNGAYRGRLEDEELEQKQAEARAALFDTLTSVPGVGPAGKWSQFAFEQAVGQISERIGEADATASADYAELSSAEKDRLREMILNRMLARGYFADEHITAANGNETGTRYAAPPAEAIVPGDPPTFDFDSPAYQDWLRLKFPLDDFLNSNVFVPYTESLNDGLKLAEGS